MENLKKYNKTKIACYLGSATQAVCANFIPLLYVTFHDSYGITFERLALISTVFFFTQLVVDYFCTKIVDKIGYRPCIIVSEITSGLGLAGLAFLPDLTSSPFAGIMICVTVYAIGSGLTEVLTSPIIEACPFENKSATMSLLHSFYCWGTVGVILISTAFFVIFGIENWKILVLAWSVLPFFNVWNYATCPIEKLVENDEGMSVRELAKTRTFWIFIVLMICAGASELSMAQWASAFVESALHVSKTVGDLVGPCGFAVFMGVSRVLYGKYSEKINLTVYMAVSGALCLCSYLLAGFAEIPLFGLIGCVICGFSVGIMWPGSISVASGILPKGGTAMFALLALAGDLGGSIGPSIVGVISQNAGENLQAGVLATIVFPIVLVICSLSVGKKYKSAKSGG